MSVLNPLSCCSACSPQASARARRFVPEKSRSTRVCSGSSAVSRRMLSRLWLTSSARCRQYSSEAFGKMRWNVRMTRSCRPRRES